MKYGIFFLVLMVAILAKSRLVAQNNCLLRDTTDEFSGVRTANTNSTILKQFKSDKTVIFFQFTKNSIYLICQKNEDRAFDWDNWFIQSKKEAKNDAKNKPENGTYHCKLKFLNDTIISLMSHSMKDGWTEGIGYYTMYLFKLNKPILNLLSTQKLKIVRFEMENSWKMDNNIDEDKAQQIIESAKCIASINKGIEDKDSKKVKKK
ncbi:MAG: hypothetical protein ACOYLG_01105 [Chitinophagaceae bacterium]